MFPTLKKGGQGGFNISEKFDHLKSLPRLPFSKGGASSLPCQGEGQGGVRLLINSNRESKNASHPIRLNPFPTRIIRHADFALAKKTKLDYQIKQHFIGNVNCD